MWIEHSGLISGVFNIYMGKVLWVYSKFTFNLIQMDGFVCILFVFIALKCKS